ncbi:hypothetical protein DUI87_18007 [Hirundo rustica rustica]|uniref:Uncharacterized protein n=1 Tax=Hirundo rustica rustica TaxID=333673 RepID=A0A3M0JUX0_HIRRU|nr:hypothetical protein DUI87_18007 [Hirundo rustica rustica]
MASGADGTCTECSDRHEEAQVATDTEERLRKQGGARKQKAALHFPLLKYSEEGSEKPLKEAQITLETAKEAGFQRTAENEDQQHQGGQLSPVVDQWERVMSAGDLEKGQPQTKNTAVEAVQHYKSNPIREDLLRSCPPSWQRLTCSKRTTSPPSKEIAECFSGR